VIQKQISVGQTKQFSYLSMSKSRLPLLIDATSDVTMANPMKGVSKIPTIYRHRMNVNGNKESPFEILQNKGGPT